MSLRITHLEFKLHLQNSCNTRLSKLSQDIKGSVLNGHRKFEDSISGLSDFFFFAFYPLLFLFMFFFLMLMRISGFLEIWLWSHHFLCLLLPQVLKSPLVGSWAALMMNCCYLRN